MWCNIYNTAGSREAGGCVQRMENVEESFNAFLSECFPPNTKRSTSGVFLAEFGCQVNQVFQDHHQSCVSWKGKSQSFCCQDCKKKIVYLHVDVDLISSHLSSLSILVLIIDLIQFLCNWLLSFIYKFSQHHQMAQ